MKQTVTETMFIDAFKRCRPENFSHDGLLALFEYCEDMERDQGEEMELDVISLCCDFCEYDSMEEAAAECGWEADADDDEDARKESARDFLEYRTQVIEVNGGGVIIQNF